MEISKEEKLKILANLENALPDLRQYELAEVDVTENLPMEKSLAFFSTAVALFQALTYAEKKKCPEDFILTFHRFERLGIHIDREDRSQQGTSLKVPSWTLIVKIGGENFGVYTLGRVIVREMQKALS